MNIKLGSFALLARIYLLVLSVFSAIRLLFFWVERHRVSEEISGISDVAKAFMIGFRFDIVIASYFLILPAIVLFIQDFFSKKVFIRKLVFWMTFLLFSVAFLISVVDIPYFDHFFSHVSIAVFSWTDTPDVVAKMILQEPKYYLFLIGGIVVFYLFYRGLKAVFANFVKAKPSQAGNKILQGLASLLVLFLMFIGIRGADFKGVPIQNNIAYFSNDPFINQLGITPTFFFLHSYLHDVGQNQRVKFLPDDLAINQVKDYLNIKNTTKGVPISRKVFPDSVATKKFNVVLVLMESMSAAKMTRHGNKNNITPFLDSLSYESYYFENLYSAGQHTFNGIFGTLFSLPALYHKHPLKEIKIYNGMPKVMRSLGYSTTYFTTHNLRFDNTGIFLGYNNFERTIGEDDYPPEEVKTSFGVPDDYMFRFAMPILDELAKDEKPFFTTFLTTSDHSPFFLPDYFKPHSSNERHRMTEYADWSIRQLIELSQKKEWFDNTIFVLIADHGEAANPKYDIPLSYHHSPLLIYAPKLLRPKLFDEIAGQIDCFPTVMGVLQLPYTNSTLGIDLAKEDRPYIFFNADNKLGVLDKEFFLIYYDDTNIKLHKYQGGDQKNYAADYPEKVADMLRYMKANLQTYQHINENSSRLLTN